MDKSFFRACGSCKIGKINSLIKKVDVNALNPQGKTGLHLALSSRHHNWKTSDVPACKEDIRRTVQILIQSGANVDTVCKQLTPLDLVLGWEVFDADIAAMILSASKLGINRCDEDGLSYLYSAITAEAAKFLVDNGINVDMLDNSGVTYIQWMRSRFPDNPAYLYVSRMSQNM